MYTKSDENMKDEISRFEKQIDSVNTEIGNLEDLNNKITAIERVYQEQ